VNISPKFSRKNSNEIYYISVRNKKFEIRLVNLVKQTNRLILKKDSLRQIDINENDDLLISYYNKKKKKYDISLYNRYTMNNEIKLTSVGNNIYPFFLEKTVILYLKGNKSNKQATILDLKTGETLMFESSISGNIQSVSY
jgi:Tol biopolymer transport system component